MHAKTRFINTLHTIQGSYIWQVKWTCLIYSKQICVNYSKQSMRFIASISIWTKNNQANLWQTNKFEPKIIKQIYDKQINLN